MTIEDRVVSVDKVIDHLPNSDIKLNHFVFHHFASSAFSSLPIQKALCEVRRLCKSMPEVAIGTPEYGATDDGHLVFRLKLSKIKDKLSMEDMVMSNKYNRDNPATAKQMGAAELKCYADPQDGYDYIVVVSEPVANATGDIRPIIERGNVNSSGAVDFIARTCTKCLVLEATKRLWSPCEKRSEYLDKISEIADNPMLNAEAEFFVDDKHGRKQSWFDWWREKVSAHPIDKVENPGKVGLKFRSRLDIDLSVNVEKDVDIFTLHHMYLLVRKLAERNPGWVDHYTVLKSIPCARPSLTINDKEPV